MDLDRVRIMMESMPERIALPVVETTQYGPNGPVRNGLRAGVEYKCLELEPWKQVLAVGIAYKGLYDWRLEIQGLIRGLLYIVEQQDALMMNYQLQLKVYKDDRAYLQLRIAEMQRVVASDQRGARLEKGFLYGMVAVQAVLLVIVGIMGVK